MQILKWPKEAHTGLNSAAPDRICLTTFILPKSEQFIRQFLEISWTPSGGSSITMWK